MTAKRKRRGEPEVRTAQDEGSVTVVVRDLNPCKCGTGRRCPVHALREEDLRFDPNGLGRAPSGDEPR